MKAVIQLHKLFKKDEDYKKRKQAFTQDQDSKVSNGEQDLTRQKETLIALEAHFRELEKGFLSKAYHEAVTATKCLTVKGLHTPTCILRYGCPRDSRREIWLAITGARDLKHQHGGPRYYTQCIQNATESNTKQIAKDLHRTSPLLAVFHDSMNTESLRRVLFAVATHLKHSYCQGMNVVAALLLLVYTPRHELDVFYTLISLVERNKYSAGYYDATLSGVQRDIRVLDYLIFQDDPLFSTHLQNILGIRPAGLFVDWLLCLFVGVVPTEWVLRIWDLYILRGIPAILTIFRSLVRHSSTTLANSDVNTAIDKVQQVRRQLRNLVALDKVLIPTFSENMHNISFDELRQLRTKAINGELLLDESSD